MDWKEYAKELLIFQVKVFSLPIEDVSKEKIEEFKNEFNELKKMGKLDWDAEALVENYYDEIGKIVDKLEKLLNDEDLIFGNLIDDVNTGAEYSATLANATVTIDGEVKQSGKLAAFAGDVVLGVDATGAVFFPPTGAYIL